MKVVRRITKKPVPKPKRVFRVSMDDMPALTSKLKAIIAAHVTAVFGVIAWLATVPPETQSGILGAFVAALPLEWRPTIGLWSRVFAAFAGVYASYQAAHSGPQTPPPNSPT